ncbi:hypothetical protein V502_01036 [Pseudogymnoascus sp. VKM F-4520 (FW-2644)]|nr:hypothetical protein V502_01036 [Pseudogymnoascus sp. VKM F-4520 (FW-2644)]
MATYSGFAHLESRAVNSTAYIDDNSFSPFFDLPGSATFDFTLLFEETILSITPSAILLLLIPPRILQLWKTPHKVISSYLLTTKIALLAVFTAALLALVATLGLCILSYVEHSKNIRPSSIINAYLLLTLPFDATQLRTRWLRGDNLAGNSVASSVLAVKLFVLVSEATEKTRILFTPYVDRSPEDTSGFRNVVNDDDLFAGDKYLLSKSLDIRFRRHWAGRKKYPKKHTLVWVMFRMMLGSLTASVLPRLVLTFFRFMQPLLINSITKLVGDPDSESATNRGWGLTAAFGLVYISLAVAGGAY